MIRPKNFSGDGTVIETGIEATHGERNRASVVAFEIASALPGSGVSAGVSVFCAAKIGAQRKKAKTQIDFMERSTKREEFTISFETRQLSARQNLPGAVSETQKYRPLTPFSLETKQEGALV